MITAGYILWNTNPVPSSSYCVKINFAGHNKHDTDIEPWKEPRGTVVSMHICLRPLALLFSCYYILGGPKEKTVCLFLGKVKYVISKNIMWKETEIIMWWSRGEYSGQVCQKRKTQLQRLFSPGYEVMKNNKLN